MHTNNLQTIVKMYYKFQCAVLNKQLHNLYIMFRSFTLSDFHQYCVMIMARLEVVSCTVQRVIQY